MPSAAGEVRWSQAIFDEIRAPGERAREGLDRMSALSYHRDSVSELIAPS